MIMNRHLRMAVVVALALVMSFAADGFAKVTIVSNFSSDPTRQALYRQAADEFTKRTGIEVELLHSPGSQRSKWEKVTTMVAGGNPPDIVNGISTEFVRHAASGLIQPFDAFIRSDAVDMSNLIGTMVDALQWRGSQYVMPYGSSGQALFYNRNVFDESGVAYPPSEWNDSSWTWEQFVSDLRKMTHSEGDRITQFGLSGGLGGWIDLGYHFGADWVNDDLTKWTGNGEKMIHALEEYQALEWDDHVQPQPGESAEFLNGEAGMSQTGSWGFQRHIDSDISWDFAPYPSAEGNPPVGVVYPVGMTLLSASQHKDEAWQLVKFLSTDPLGNYLWARAGGALPSVKENLPEWVDRYESLRPDANFMLWGQQVQSHAAIIRVRKLSTYGQIDAVMNDVLDSIMSENKPPRLAMDEIAGQMQGLVDEAASGK